MPSFKLQASKEFSKFYWYGASPFVTSYFIFVLLNKWRQCNPSIHSTRPKMHFIVVLITTSQINIIEPLYLFHAFYIKELVMNSGSTTL